MTDETSWTSPSAQTPPAGPPAAPATGTQPPPPGSWGAMPPPAGPPVTARSWQPAPPVHKPGIVPLRPLRVGDMFDGAFTAIRQNPRTMIGMAAVVMTWFLLLPTGGSLALAAAGRLEGPFRKEDFTSPDTAPPQTDLPLSLVMTYLGQILAAFAALLVTGLVVHVVAQAVLGRRVATAEAWRAVRGRVLRLVGLTILSTVGAMLPLLVAVGIGIGVGLVLDPVAGVLLGLGLGVAGLVATAYFYVRFAVLAPAALVLEGLGVVGALRRAGELTRGQFWRVLGIALLAQVVAGFAAGFLSMPFSLAGTFGFLFLPDAWTGLGYVLGTYLGMLVSYSLSVPFTAAVTVLQYVDQRIRKEAFDVALMQSAARGAGA